MISALPRWIWRIWQEIDDDVRDRARTDLDWRPLVVLCVVAVSLTVQYYVGDRGFFYNLEAIPYDVRAGDWGEFLSFAWWIGWRILGFLGGSGARGRAHAWRAFAGLSPLLEGFAKHWKPYVGFLVVAVPVIALASRMPVMQGIYPFYRQANRSALDFWAWEGLYAAQFVSLEFFFCAFMC